MDEHSTWYTQSGENITLYVEQEAGTCYVSVESDALGYIQFNFNPDFPQDANAFFAALKEVRCIAREE